MVLRRGRFFLRLLFGLLVFPFRLAWFLFGRVIDFLIDSFDLWKVYKIKTGNPKAHFKLRKAFRENFNIILTKQDEFLTFKIPLL